MKQLFLLLLTTACTSVPKLAVKSTPEKATVSLLNPQTLAYESLGETPLELDPKSVKVPVGEMSVLRVEKPGFVPENILLPTDRLRTTEVVLALKQNNQWLRKDHASVSKLAQEMARRLYSINRFTNEKKYGEALAEADALLRNYPEAPIFYDIKGSLHVLRDEKDLAKQSFRRSLELAPDNLQTRRALEKLE